MHYALTQLLSLILDISQPLQTLRRNHPGCIWETSEPFKADASWLLFFWAQYSLNPLCVHFYNQLRVRSLCILAYKVCVSHVLFSKMIAAFCTFLLTDSADFSPDSLVLSRGKMGVIVASNGTRRLAPLNLCIWSKLKVIFNNCADELR